jgi:hypothetical protein
MLLLPFSFHLVFDRICNPIVTKNVDLAYLNISFEREAYAHGRKIAIILIKDFF